MIGGPANTKPFIESVPILLLTLIAPLTPVPTIAAIVVLFTILKEAAGTPPKSTEFTPKKLPPVSVTVVPLDAVEGEKLIIEGSPALFLSKLTLLLVKMAAAISGFPSELKSAHDIANALGERLQ